MRKSFHSNLAVSADLKMSPSFAERAIAVRGLVRQARRLSACQTVEAERARLARYADELEAHALNLERLAEKGNDT